MHHIPLLMSWRAFLRYDNYFTTFIVKLIFVCLLGLKIISYYPAMYFKYIIHYSLKSTDFKIYKMKKKTLQENVI